VQAGIRDERKLILAHHLTGKCYEKYLIALIVVILANFLALVIIADHYNLFSDSVATSDALMDIDPSNGLR